MHAQRVRQVVKDVRLLMVFDDDLEAAARALAEGEARGLVYESPAKGASLLAIRDGMMTYTSSAASTAKSVGGGLMGAALSTGSSFFSGSAACTTPNPNPFRVLVTFCDLNPEPQTLNRTLDS